MYNVFIRKSKQKSSFGKQKHRWENAIKINVKATALKAKDQFTRKFASDRIQCQPIVNTVMNPLVLESEEFLENMSTCE